MLRHDKNELVRLLTRGDLDIETPARFAEAEIERRTVWVEMRDGIRLATDLYLPPALPAPAVARRSPYGKATAVESLLAFAQRGYAVISQDCRGTGQSEPDVWEYYVYEPEDGVDFVEWVIAQPWCDGHLFSTGGSYTSSTQWCMAAHPRMTAIVPEVSGLQVSRGTVDPHMFVNAYSRSVGKGANRLSVPYTEIERVMEAETMATGYYNEPVRRSVPDAVLDAYPELRELDTFGAKRRLWEMLCSRPPAERDELLKLIAGVSEFTYADMYPLMKFFAPHITYGIHTIPSRSAAELCRRFHAPALAITGWYDWGVDDMLRSWIALRRDATDDVAARSRLLVTPSAHNMPGYHVGAEEHPELRRLYRNDIELMLRWYEAVCDGDLDDWPAVTYYLMGANAWQFSDDWPVPGARETAFYLHAGGVLSMEAPEARSIPDRYFYDPKHPTPTVGGSIVSYIYPPGSVDLSAMQQRGDILTYTSAPLERDLDVVGPLRMILYAATSAPDTDFAARLSDVFPDGRAILLQDGIVHARDRIEGAEPALVNPHETYRFEIDMSATANRFKAGHRIRLDIFSADFPRFQRNANRGGEPGSPIAADQRIFHDSEHPSHLLVSVLGSSFA